jgi:RNA polymerase sigma factor (sigma-70 family)
MNTKIVERTDVVTAHLKDINKIYPLTAQEERDLFVKYENSTDEKERLSIRDKIVEASLRYNFTIAKCYSTGDNLSDLISVGIIGMYEAFEDYDWRKGVRFYTFAQYYIRRACNAYLAKDNLTVRTKNYARVVPKVKKIEKEFSDKNGRVPTSEEIMSILNEEYGIDVSEEIDIYGARVDKIDAYLGDDEDSTFGDSAEFNGRTAVYNEYEEHIEDESNAHAVDAALSALTDREKTIVSMAFGYGYPREYKDKEIGEEIGLTSERVRQIKHAAVKKMRAAVVTAKNQ